MAMTQAESYADLWIAHRDRAGPLTPDDVWGLREDRHFQPPSRAHLKRLARPRPDVTPLHERPALVDAQRTRINQALKFGRAVERLHRPNLFLEAKPVPYVRPAPMPGGVPVYAPDHMTTRNEQLFAEAARLASYGMAALGDALRAYRMIR